MVCLKFPAAILFTPCDSSLIGCVIVKALKKVTITNVNHRIKKATRMINRTTREFVKTFWFEVTPTIKKPRKFPFETKRIFVVLYSNKPFIFGLKSNELFLKSLEEKGTL